MVQHDRGDANLPLRAAQESMTVRRVFGEAYEVDGVRVIPVAKVIGGSGMGFGGGSGWDPRAERDDAVGAREPDAEGSGGGGGFGVRVKALGVFVVRDGEVRWRPALDLNRVILGGQVLGAVAVVSVAVAMTVRGLTRG